LERHAESEQEGSLRNFRELCLTFPDTIVFVFVCDTCTYVHALSPYLCVCMYNYNHMYITHAFKHIHTRTPTCMMHIVSSSLACRRARYKRGARISRL
jgi:hypothetical protein